MLLVEVEAERVAQINRGESYIEDVPSEKLSRLVRNGLRATTDYDELRDADAILVALPTPLSKQREPDLSIIEGAVREIAKRLRPGHRSVNEGGTVVIAGTPAVARFSRVVHIRHHGLFRALVKTSDPSHVSGYSAPILVR